MQSAKWISTILVGMFIILEAAAFTLTDSDPNSPEARKSFLASYGVNADIEPTLTQKDRPLYEAIAPHLSSDPQFAIQQVESKLTNESNAAFDFLLGNLYYSIQDYAQSERNLRNAISKFPSFRRAYRTLALIQAQQGQLSESIENWLKVIALGGGDGQSYGLLAYAYLNEEKFNSSLTAYQMARMFAPDSLDYRRGEAQCLLMTQQYDSAIALFDELIVESPANSEFWLLQANAFLGKDNYEDAIANLEIAHDLIESPTWESLTLLGDLHLNKEMPQLAIATYQQALNKHPSISAEKALSPLRSLLRTGRFEAAKAYITTLDALPQLKLSPELRLEKKLMTAEVLFGNGAIIKARKHLQEVLKADPINGTALILLGNHELEAGNLAEAELHLERASHLSDHRVEAWVGLGKLAVERRKFNTAISFFQKAYKLEQSEHLNAYIKRLKNIAK